MGAFSAPLMRIADMADTLTITGDMIIHDVVSRHPETVKIFHGHGLPCTACAVGARESVAGGARTHRFTPEKLDLLIKDLNACGGGVWRKSQRVRADEGDDRGRRGLRSL